MFCISSSHTIFLLSSFSQNILYTTPVILTCTSLTPCTLPGQDKKKNKQKKAEQQDSTRHPVSVLCPSLCLYWWPVWEPGTIIFEAARSADSQNRTEAVTEAALGSHKSRVTAHLPAWGTTLSAATDPWLVAVPPQDTQLLAAELILLSKTGDMLFTARRMTAKTPNDCRSEEQLFCLRKNDQVSHATMLFWKAANSKPDTYPGMWNPPSGKWQVCLQITLLYMQLHLLLTNLLCSSTDKDENRTSLLLSLTPECWSYL